MAYAEKITDLIGNTPLVKIRALGPDSPPMMTQSGITG